jgi:prefoldin subunit 5
VDVAQLQRQVDDLSRRYREMDSQIQAMNWQVDLVEP